jgi:hypothetical protein
MDGWARFRGHTFGIDRFKGPGRPVVRLSENFSVFYRSWSTEGLKTILEAFTACRENPFFLLEESHLAKTGHVQTMLAGSVENNFDRGFMNDLRTSNEIS